MWPERKPGARDCGLVNVIVLCLDDEARETIANLFNTLPVRTFITNSGSHANRILNDVPCRPIVTDRLLPPWPGLGRISRLLVRRPGLRIAFVDNVSPDGRMLAYAIGATDFLAWPLTRRSLVDLLARLRVAQ